jgi:hypothetical protein
VHTQSPPKRPFIVEVDRPTTKAKKERHRCVRAKKCRGGVRKRAQRRSVLWRRKRAASLGGCRGETPRTPPAAG